MKRFFFWLVFLSLIGFSFWFFFKETSPPPLTEKKTTVETDNFRQEMKEVVSQEKKFLFLDQKISRPEKLVLLPNFEKKLPSTQLFRENNCRFLINGGFYDQQDQPLGWFFTQKSLFKKEIKSALLNGFFFQDKQGKIIIDDVGPQGPVVWGLQTGPLLIFQNQPVRFRLARDEQARRMVVALNQKDELIFLVITNSDSLAIGPPLTDLPAVVKKIGEELKEEFKTAVNLDGGTASAFINQAKKIKEYTWIGSFFCLPND